MPTKNVNKYIMQTRVLLLTDRSQRAITRDWRTGIERNNIEIKVSKQMTN